MSSPKPPVYLTEEETIGRFKVARDVAGKDAEIARLRAALEAAALMLDAAYCRTDVGDWAKDYAIARDAAREAAK